MARQEGREVRGDRDRAHSGPAAAVRDAEGLVQVQVTHVGADRRRLREPELRVHVRAVHVHLSARFVHDLAELADLFLEDAVGRRVGEHQRTERVLVLRRARAQVGDVDVPARVAGDRDDPEARHHRARRVRPVRRDRDQADVAARVAAAPVVRADREQARVLALGARVRLQRHRGEAGDLGEPLLEVREDLGVALGLRLRRERVELRELRPAHRDHLGGPVELHRARAERDHRVREREVAGLQPSEVAEHLVLRVVRVEDRVREEAAQRAKGAGGGPTPPATLGAERDGPPANASKASAPRPAASSRRVRCPASRRRRRAG
jgi:hypothetical protein